MGKIQCVSLKKSETWEILERYLNNINTPFEKRIYDEYYSIKNKKVTDTDFSSIPLQKRLQRFVKWYKMSSLGGSNLNLERYFTDKLPHTPVKLKRPISPLRSLANSDDIYTNTWGGNYSEIKPRKSLIGSQMTSFDFDSNMNSISINSNISTNRVENNFRLFYLAHKNTFCRRVAKSPPESFRWLAWMICSGMPEDRNEDFFLHYLKEPIEDEIDIQIKKDLNRTLSEIYDINQNDTQNYLYRQLRAFSSVDKTVAYCQGMNFIAGFLLLISDFNEVDCFYMLLNLFSETFSSNFGIRGFYTEEFPLLKAYLYAFEFHFQKKFPKLFKHFKDLEIPDEVWIAKWFQTLYTICLPLTILIRFWDCLFSSGLEFLVSFSLGLIQQLEKDLLKLEDAFDVIEFFKKLGPFFTNLSNSKLHLNIDEILHNAKKLNISKSSIQELIKEYEKKNNTDLSYLKIKYDTNVLRYSFFKPQDSDIIINSPEIIRKIGSKAGENLILVNDAEDDLQDCDEFIIEKVDVKLSNYKLNYKFTPSKVLPDES
jgi:hypothetical protein